MHSGIIIIIILLRLPRIFQRAHGWRPEKVGGFSRLVTSPVSSQGNERGFIAAVWLFQAFLRHDLIEGTRSGPGCGEDKAERGHCAELSAGWTDERKKEERQRTTSTRDITGNTLRWRVYSPAIVLECCLIQQQSKNKPLSGSFSWAEPATSPHLLCTVKT